MGNVTSLLAKAGSGVAFSFGVRTWTEMEIQCVKGMHRLKLTSSEKNLRFKRVIKHLKHCTSDWCVLLLPFPFPISISSFHFQFLFHFRFLLFHMPLHFYGAAMARVNKKEPVLNCTEHSQILLCSHGYKIKSGCVLGTFDSCVH